MSTRSSSLIREWPGTLPGTASHSGGPIRWAHPTLTFELSSNAPEVMARAASVFRPWRIDSILGSPYRFSIEPVPGGWRVSSCVHPGPFIYASAGEAVTAVEYMAVHALLSLPDQPLYVHCALVAKGGDGVLIVGHRQAGKSTLACSLWRRGFSLLSDDNALVDTEQTVACPTPRRVSLRRSSRELLGEALMQKILATPSCEPTLEGWLFHPDEIDQRPRQLSVRLRAVVFLGRGGSTPRRLSPAHGALALLPISNLLPRLDLGAALRHVAPLFATLPCLDLPRGPVQEMAAAIEDLLDSPC